MTSSLPVCVVDTNILIDLHMGGLVQEVFRLPLQLVAPDVIVAELQEPDGAQLVQYGLESQELDGRQVQAVVGLRQRYSLVSANDLFALVLAQSLHATLLTGDRRLRQIAEQENVPAHGTLWLLDELVRLRLISPLRATQALQGMLDGGSRLPMADCRRRFNQWKAR